MIPPIFREICRPHHSHDVDEPFHINDWVYATNGRIVVRVPDRLCARWELEAYSSNGRKLPDVSTVDHCWTAERLAPVPLVCGCESYLPCPLCNVGWLSCYPLLPCSRSDICAECDGEGWVSNMKGVPHGDCYLVARYVGLLDRHGIREIEPVTAKANGSHPVYFRTTEWEGLLMPMDPDKVEAAA